MAVRPMRFVTLAAPSELFDEIALNCVIDQQFHLENAQQMLGQVHDLRPMPLSNPWAPLLRRADALLERLGLAAAYRPLDGPMDPEAAEGYLKELETRLDGMESKLAALRQEEADATSTAEQLEKLSGLDVDLTRLRDMDFVRFRFGHMPRQTYEEFRDMLDARPDLFLFPSRTERKNIYVICFTTRQDQSKVFSLLNSLHFVAMHLDASAGGNAEESCQALYRRAEDARQSMQQLEQERKALTEQQEERLLAVRAWLCLHEQAADLRRSAAQTRNTFYLVGWVPADELPALQKKFSRFRELSVVVDDPGDDVPATPPTKLKNGFLARIFEPFLQMYGLPGYYELDPSLFMAVTYCVFFGIMFGDVGQGALLLILGIALAKWKKMWLGRIIACCGVGAMMFGCVYGSVFGFEDVLPGFKILEGNNVVLLLVASLVMGVFMLAFVMVVNIINGIRQRDFDKIFFGPNGAAGMVFYLGLVIAAVVTLFTGVNLFRAWYVVPVLILPLVLILLREPLSRLAAGDPDWKPESIGGMFVSGFFELFETMLSFLTNTLSFLRVGAYAITHVSLMLVIRALAGASPNLIVLVLGNLFVTGFEGLLVGIQVLRLEFYELFGRFYKSEGRPYSPKLIDYSAKSV